MQKELNMLPIATAARTTNRKERRTLRVKEYLMLLFLVNYEMQIHTIPDTSQTVILMLPTARTGRQTDQ